MWRGGEGRGGCRDRAVVVGVRPHSTCFVRRVAGAASCFDGCCCTPSDVLHTCQDQRRALFPPARQTCLCCACLAPCIAHPLPPPPPSPLPSPHLHPFSPSPPFVSLPPHCHPTTTVRGRSGFVFVGCARASGGERRRVLGRRLLSFLVDASSTSLHVNKHNHTTSMSDPIHTPSPILPTRRRRKEPTAECSRLILLAASFA